MSKRKKRDIETELLALFDTHARIAEAKADVLREYDDPEERGAVIKSFDRAEQKIAETASDRVQHHIEMIEEMER